MMQSNFLVRETSIRGLSRIPKGRMGKEWHLGKPVLCEVMEAGDSAEMLMDCNYETILL